MPEPDTDTSEKEVQHISAEEVDLALQLATHETQLARHVSETKTSFFCFLLPCERHFVAVAIRITPFRSQHILYHVLALYEPCCDTIRDTRVDQQIQLVYDVYIRVVRFRLDENCRKKFPPLLDPASNCQRKATSALDRLVQYTDTDDADAEQGEGVKDKETENPRENEVIAKRLTRKIIAGMKKISRREEQDDTLPIQAIVKDALGRVCCGKEAVDTVLNNLEVQLLQSSKDTVTQGKALAWTKWYYAVCLRYILYKRGQAQPNRRKTPVDIIHLTVNDLIRTEGIDAMAVLLALAASNASEPNQIAIAQITAHGLRGKLISPPEHCVVPCPAVWVMIVTGVSYEQACYDLGIANLAVLGLHGRLVKVAESTLDLTWGAPFSLAKKIWSNFTAMQPWLQQDLQKRSANWAHVSEEQKFVSVIARWCSLTATCRQNEVDNCARQVIVQPRGPGEEGARTYKRRKIQQYEMDDQNQNRASRRPRPPIISGQLTTEDDGDCSDTNSNVSTAKTPRHGQDSTTKAQSVPTTETAPIGVPLHQLAAASCKPLDPLTETEINRFAESASATGTADLGNQQQNTAVRDIRGHQLANNIVQPIIENVHQHCGNPTTYRLAKRQKIWRHGTDDLNNSCSDIQPSPSAYSDSGHFSLPDGSSLPIQCLTGQAPINVDPAPTVGTEGAADVSPCSRLHNGRQAGASLFAPNDNPDGPELMDDDAPSTGHITVGQMNESSFDFTLFLHFPSPPSPY